MGVLSDLVGVFTGEPLIPPRPAYQPPKETPEQQASRVEAQQEVDRSKARMNALAEKGRK